MVKHTFRLAFTFLELIFAIVVIGISVMSLPTINQVLNAGLEKNLAQEAIFMTSADIIRAMSGQWDENSKLGSENFERTLYTSAAEITLFDTNTSRLGYINILFHPDKLLGPSAVGSDGANDLLGNDDIDDYHSGNVNINSLDGAITGTGFKNSYKRSTNVTTNETFGSYTTNNPNIKKITVTTSRSDDVVLTQLYMYVFNTGSAASKTRELLLP